MVDETGVIGSTTRKLQIILGSMAVGVAIFIGVVVFAIPGPERGGGGVPDRPGPVAALPALSVAAYTFTAILLPLSFVIPGVVAESLRKKLAAGKFTPQAGSSAMGDVDSLAAIYQTRTIVGAALNEAPAFLAAIAYMIERDPIALGLAMALLGVLVARVPTVPRAATWFDDQRARLEADRNALRLG